MSFFPNLDGASDRCTVCHQHVQLWNIGQGPAANGMLILDPDTQESQAFHFDCAAKQGHRWVTVHLGYFMPEGIAPLLHLREFRFHRWLHVPGHRA